MTPLKPGWSERQYHKALADIREWPRWMKLNLLSRHMTECRNCKEKRDCGKVRKLARHYRISLEDQ